MSCISSDPSKNIPLHVEWKPDLTEACPPSLYLSDYVIYCFPCHGPFLQSQRLPEYSWKYQTQPRLWPSHDLSLQVAQGSLPASLIPLPCPFINEAFSGSPFKNALTYQHSSSLFPFLFFFIVFITFWNTLKCYSLSIFFLTVKSMNSRLLFFSLFYALISPQHIEHCLVPVK